jgi:hypothetical protein
MAIESMNDLLALSYVPRWVIVPMSRQQSVAEHSFRVAVIVTELRSRLNKATNWSLGDALNWALIHDAPESRTGDIPGPYKHPDQERAPGVTPWFQYILVDDDLRRFVKVADLIETASWVAKFGQGPHAMYCCEKIKREMMDAAAAAGVSQDLVTAIYQSIVREIGRWADTAQRYYRVDKPVTSDVGGIPMMDGD